MYQNNLHTKASSNELCKAFGIKYSSNAQIVQLACNAGFDALFIDLEHGWLTLAEASNICNVAMLAGISPFVRVPHQCGNGFVQRVLDGGAMGIVFPHIHTAADAEAAVRISKYPPRGCRSMTGQMPLFNMKTVPVPEVMESANKSGSTVLCMVESKDGVENADDIAAVDGVDVVLIGSMDLSIDLGIPAQFNAPEYRSAVETVSKACKKHGTILGIAGVYDNPEVQGWAINTLGARFMLVAQDGSLIYSGGVKAVNALQSIIT